MQDIQSLSDIECSLLIDELNKLDSDTERKVNVVMNISKVSIQMALEYVINDSIPLWAKVYLNWEGRQYQLPILQECKKSRRLVLRLGRRLGKCLTKDTLISDSETGEQISVYDLCKRENANVFSLDTNTNKLVSVNTDEIFPNGIQPIYKIKTKAGREIKVTDNHPFYTYTGWKECRDLSIGEYISIATNQVHSNPVFMPEEEIRLLAYMIGDGNCTSTTIRFSCNVKATEKIDEMKECCKYFKCVIKQYKYNKPSDYNIVSEDKRAIRENGVLSVMRKHGLFGKGSHTKTIPNDIYKLSNEQLKLFLNRLFSTDGWAFTKNTRTEIGYCSVNKTLVSQIQSLLLRFDINSYIYKKKVKNKRTGATTYAYHLIICGMYNILRFCDEIGIFDNPSIDIIKDRFKNKTYLKKIPQGIPNNFDLYKDDICWDAVREIECIGEEETYDLTVPKYHNFVANDFITHNTEVQCISVLWHAFRQPNAKTDDPNFTYSILVLAPYEKQVDLIFKRLNELIDNSTMFQGLLKKRKQHHIELNNGCTILGLTLGASSGEGSSTRGQKASLLCIDEVDYVGSKPISNVMNIANEDPSRIKVMALSTPSGKHEEFYHWCMNATKTYAPMQDDIDNFRFTGYEISNREKGNGWTQLYAPSTVNSTILDINPDTGQTYLQDIKDELSELRFQQEVMAQFGDQELGVYKHEYIDGALLKGLSRSHKYWDEYTELEKSNFFVTRNSKVLIASMDFDISQSTPNILCLCYDRLDKDVDGSIRPIFKVLFRIDIPRTEFTLDSSVQKLIQLNEIFNFDHVIMDRGLGECMLYINISILPS